MAVTIPVAALSLLLSDILIYLLGEIMKGKE